MHAETKKHNNNIQYERYEDSKTRIIMKNNELMDKRSMEEKRTQLEIVDPDLGETS